MVLTAAALLMHSSSVDTVLDQRHVAIEHERNQTQLDFTLLGSGSTQVLDRLAENRWTCENFWMLNIPDLSEPIHGSMDALPDSLVCLVIQSLIVHQYVSTAYPNIQSTFCSVLFNQVVQWITAACQSLCGISRGNKDHWSGRNPPRCVQTETSGRI